MAKTALRTRDHPKIITYAPDGAPNGYLLPIYVHDRPRRGESDGAKPQQVYCTEIAPHTIKGPHLHDVRTGRFTCLYGNVRLVVAIGVFRRISPEIHPRLPHLRSSVAIGSNPMPQARRSVATFDG